MNNEIAVVTQKISTSIRIKDIAKVHLALKPDVNFRQRRLPEGRSWRCGMRALMVQNPLEVSIIVTGAKLYRIIFRITPLKSLADASAAQQVTIVQFYDRYRTIFKKHYIRSMKPLPLEF